jgi:serine/threonine protein kinase
VCAAPWRSNGSKGYSYQESCLLNSRVVVADLGCCSAQGLAREPTSSSGTRAYMPQEQLDGEGQTASVDTYALGVTLLEAL